MKLQESGEDYLEAILRIEEEKGMVHSVDIARSLEVSRASVSHAVSVLREGGYLTMDADNLLHLTESGRAVAEEIYERHRFFQKYLMENGVDPVTAESEACRIEHVISADTFDKLKRNLSGTEAESEEP